MIDAVTLLSGNNRVLCQNVQRPVLGNASPPYCFPLLYRQLDKNQISCIEEGAFRALRGLEVL